MKFLLIVVILSSATPATRTTIEQNAESLSACLTAASVGIEEWGKQGQIVGVTCKGVQ